MEPTIYDLERMLKQEKEKEVVSRFKKAHKTRMNNFKKMKTIKVQSPARDNHASILNEIDKLFKKL